MNLDEIVIHRFRGLKEVALKGLSRVNLLIGPNDLGKTSILEAVAAFSRPLDLRVWLDATWRREILRPDESFFIWLEWMFPHEANSNNGAFTAADTRISGSGAFVVKEARASYKKKSRIRARSPRDADSGLNEEGYEEAGSRKKRVSEVSLSGELPIKQILTLMSC